MESELTGTGRVIWQYWETRGEKPAFIDGLHRIAEANAGVPVIQVTPETLPDYLPDLDPDILRIGEMAHKADMLRTRLIARHGGMWLDSDAIVLKDLSFIFDHLETHDFVGFNDGGRLEPHKPWVRVNCFAARPGSQVMQAWIDGQNEKLPRLTFDWEEIGTEILHPACLARKEIVKILPFETIAPITWDKVEKFASPWHSPADVIDDCTVVMLSNKALETRLPKLRRMSVEEIAAADIYVAHFLRRALDPGYRPPSQFGAIATGLRRKLAGTA